jgi:hypothetical protein
MNPKRVCENKIEPDKTLYFKTTSKALNKGAEP